MSLLLGLVPLLWALLPERFDLALPLATTIIAAGTCALLPRPKHLALAGWTLGAAVLVVATWRLTPGLGLGFLGLFPLGLMLLSQRTWPGVLAFAATLAWVHVPELASSSPRLGWATHTQTDMLGWMWLGNFALWHAALGLTLWEDRQWIRRRLETLPVLEHAIRRDLKALAAVASVLADRGLVGPVAGHGLTRHGLGLAARIDDRSILLGYIEGQPLATLTVGWGLLSAARTGIHDPEALHRLALDLFSDVVDREGVRWLAVWDRRTGTLTTTTPTPPKPLSRCVLTPRGPATAGPGGYADGAAAIVELVPKSPPVPELDDAASMRMLAVALVGWWLASATTLVGSAPALFIATYTVVFAVHSRLLRWQRQHAQLREQASTLLNERSTDHDELRFALARYHGTLLPYCIETDGVRALAHRLQGGVLDGTFADMVLTSRGRLRVVAGELPGRGVGPRFFALAAQIIARSLLERGDRDLAQLETEVATQLRGLLRPSQRPLDLRLGLMTLALDGSCRGFGLLRNLVVTEVAPIASDDPTRPVARERRAAITEQAEITDSRRVYVSPAPAIPGPEDEAPALAREETATRIAHVLRQGPVVPGRDSLPTLFSTIFDGRTVPAHGVLIELASAR